MKQLPFFVAPLTKELAARTLLAHTARGIALHLTSPAHLPAARHRLDLAFLLGLSSHVRWYAAPSRHSGNLSRVDIASILHWAGQYWTRPLSDLDLNSIELAIAAIPDTKVDTVTYNLNCILNHLFINKTERLQAMNLIPNSVPADILQRLEMSLASLEASLLEKDPMMPNHLRSIHTLLISYPESVQLLTDTEIARLIDGAEILTKTEIVKAAVAKTTKSKKVSADDL